MTRARAAATTRVWRATAVVAAVGALALPGCSTVTGSVSGYKMTAYFTKALSLYRHSDVRVLGLSVGKVDDVVTQGDRVRVDMTIKGSTRLPAGVQAAIMPQSLIGERFVQLYPAWVTGEPTEPHGSVVPIERTTIPVEPDEALAALKRFLDDLDPNATGRLIRNLSDDLSGNGQNLNNAISGLASLSTTLADKDQDLAALVDNFDAFTSTLSSHEQQLGTVMDEFASVSSLLAQERDQVAGLVHNLSTLSGDALELVSRHAARLQTDIGTLSHLLGTVDANLGAVDQILSAGPVLVSGPNLDSKAGLIAAYNHKFHRIDLRDELSPAVAQFLGALGLPGTTVCLPIDVSCVAPASSASSGAAAAAPPTVPPVSVPGPSTTTTVPATTSTTAPTLTIPSLPQVTVPRLTPIDGLVSLLGSPASAPVGMATYTFGSTVSRAAAHPSGAVGWLARTARHLLEDLW